MPALTIEPGPLPHLEAEPLLTSGEVATIFRVDKRTVTRWADTGKLTSIRTLGGHRRFREAEVRSMLPFAEPLLTPGEVATMFHVDPKTVTQWAKASKLTSIRTLGGHRRYRETEVRALLAGTPQQRSE